MAPDPPGPNVPKHGGNPRISWLIKLIIMFPLNLAIGPMPPLTRKLRPPGTAAPASPAQP